MCVHWAYFDRGPGKLDILHFSLESYAGPGHTQLVASLPPDPRRHSPIGFTERDHCLTLY